MAKYMTKQRKALLDFLGRHADEELSARAIEDALQSEGVSISAVYRNLADLEQEGKVRRLSKSGSREVFYRYTDSTACKDCLHLSCEKCGKTYHMSVPGAELLIENLQKSDAFTVDKAHTVLYGICRECKNS